MGEAKFVSPEQLVEFIEDGQTLLTVGMSLVGASESVLSAIESRFLTIGHPRDLTLIHCAGQSDRRGGIQHLAHEGLVRRIIGSHWGLAPRWMELISADIVEAYCLPQGQMTHWLRSTAEGLPGHLTQVGMGTFIDPRQGGGKMNSRTEAAPDLVHRVELVGNEFLWIDAVPIDWVLIRGTCSDTLGNISAEEEPMKLELLPAVFATRRFSGRVVAQVKRIVPRGTLNPRQVEVPGAHVSYVVQASDAERFHRQTSNWVFKPEYSQLGWAPSVDVGQHSRSLDIRRVIGRRAVWELNPGAIVNLGTGIPNDVIGSELSSEGATDMVTVTVESGIYGGRPAGGVDFGIAEHPDALIEHTYQFDFYDGHGVDVTFMGFGEADEEGNVNATKLGRLATGAGGFVDITQNAKKVVFCGTFTAQGIAATFDSEGELRITNEGRVRKFVKSVQQISFNGGRAIDKGQSVVLITERAVFTLTKDGWRVDEIAPGIDLRRDVMSQMNFIPVVSPMLRTMNPKIFRPGIMGIREYLSEFKEAEY